MDHEDNDFQSQGFQLAVEEGSKFPPVSHSYSLPKFDLDDTLQVHLRFDSLVESEVLLGIQSQEENQWIEDFSRESSGLEFSSGAAESCSISRPHNVWSEATSSESVDLLLKSVGQDEMVMGKPTIEEPDNCNGLDSLKSPMQPSVSQEATSPSKTEDATGVGSVSAVNDPLVDKVVVNQMPLISSTSQKNESERSTSGGLGVESPIEEKGVCLLRPGDDKILDDNSEENKSVTDSRDSGVIEIIPSSPSMQKFVNSGESNNDAPEKSEGLDRAKAERLEDHVVTSGVVICQTHVANDIDTDDKNVENLPSILHKDDYVSQNTELCEDVATECTSQATEVAHQYSLKDTVMADQFIGNPEEASLVTMEVKSTSIVYTADIRHKTELLDIHNPERAGVDQGNSVVMICQTHQENQVDTENKNVGNLSSPIQKVDCVSENTGLSSDSIVTKTTSQTSDYVDGHSANDIDMVDQFIGNPQGTSFVMEEESTSVAHSVDISADSTKTLSVQIMHASDQTMEECGNVEFVVKPRGLLEIVGDQSDEKGSVSTTEGLPGEEKAVLEPQGNKNSGSSPARETCSLTDITHESQKCEDIKVRDDGIGVHSAEACSSSPLLVDPQQMETGCLPTNSEPTGVVSEVVQMSSDNLLGGDLHLLVRSNAREEAFQQEVPDPASNINTSHLLEKGETGIGISILDAKENPLVSNDCILSSEPEHGRTCDSARAGEVVSNPSSSMEVSVIMCQKEPESDLDNINPEECSPKELDESSVRTLSQLDECPVIRDRALVETESAEVCKDYDNRVPKETEALSEDDTEGHVLEAESSCMNSSEPNCGSPTFISCSEASQAEKAPRMGSTQSLDHSDSVTSDQDVYKEIHAIADIKENDLSEDDRSFTFKVNSQGDLSQKESISGWKPFPSLQSHDIPQGVHCSGTSTPGLCETDPKMIEPKISGEGNASASSTLEDISGPKDARTAEREITEGENSHNNGLCYSGKELQKGVGRSDTDIAVSRVIDQAERVVQDPKESYAAEVGREVSSKVIPVTNILDKGNSPKWKPVHSVQSHESPRPVGVSSPMSSIRQMDFKVLQESPHKCSPQTSGAKGARRKEDKKRSSSLRAADKEINKEGKVIKETLNHTKVEGSSSSASAAVIQVVEAGDTRVPKCPEGSRTKSSAVTITPASTLPDLNSSASSYTLFQQPFTDSQQVQLRAQIFVYGSIIQGSAPDEACMLAAFSESDGGRNVWENVWRIAVERLHGQKSPLSNIKTPAQHTGSRASEATRQTIHRSEPLSTHSGVDSIKFPPVVFNPTMTFSSPIWSLSTASRDGVQSSSTPKVPFVDSSKTSHPIQPSQSPHALQYVGNSGSWLSQVPSPGSWVVTPPVAVTVSSHHPKLPVSETVRVTSIRESSAAHRSGNQHPPPGSLVHSGSPPSGTDKSLMVGTKRTTVSASKHASTESKSRKKKRSLTFEELGQISSFGQPRMIPVSVTAQPPTYAVTTTITSGMNIPSSSVTSESLPVSAVHGHISSHVQLRGDSLPVSAQSTASVSTTSGARPMDVDSGKIISQSSPVSLEEMSGRIEQAKRLAEDAAAFSATAVGHCQSIWSQLAIQKKSGMVLDLEAKLKSSAVAIAAATSVAKAAAAVAKIASEAALQAKLMADEAMITSKYGNPIPESNLNDDVKNLGTVTPSSILKGRDQTGHSDSVFVAVREAARKRVEAASAATKRAENLDAVLKAAEMTAEAVSQAGTIIAMGEPLPFTLTELVDTGPEGYWKVQPKSSEQLVKSSNLHADQTSKDAPKKSNNDSFGKCNEESSNRNEGNQTGELLKNSAENTKSLVNAFQRGSLSSSEKVLEVPKTIGVFAESQVTSENAATIRNHTNEEPQLDRTSMENKFEEGSPVEVCSDEDGLKKVWFSARVLSLKDGKAFVSYAEHARREGSSQPTEWVPLEDKGGNAPRIRPPHPLSVLKYDGTKKRSRDARGDYTWFIGDKVDAWIRNGWWEGVITEKSKEDETNLTVHFPAQRETTIVRAWNLRPSLIWEDGKWIEWCRPVSNINNEGGTPQEKPPKKSRLVGENDPVVESKGKGKISKLPSIMEVAKAETPKPPLMLSANETVFNAGKTTTKVNFGVPKPGRKKKYMDVSDRGTSTIPKPSFKTGKTQPQAQSSFSSETHSIKRKPTSVAAPNEKLVKNIEKSVAFGKSLPNSSEPRRSNRRIQPTSRLLEGLQSSLAPSKIPSASSHDKSTRSQQKTIPKGMATGRGRVDPNPNRN
ncbi:hypothetical protein ACHQM5_001442 [Ranunculus cassubicifolius]